MRTIAFFRSGKILKECVLAASLLIILIIFYTILNTNLAGIFLQASEDIDSEGIAAEYANQEEPAGRLAIIIDDFGQDRNGVKEMMSIDRHLTFAVMPFLKYSGKDAEDAHENGYEVIIHLSLEPVSGKKEWLGPKPIMSGMKDDEVRDIIQAAIEDVPYAAGANIHMGSKASSEESIIACILDEVGKRDLYFVDSRTSSKGIAARLAQNYGVACYNRHIFLDEGQPIDHIKQQLLKAMELSLKQGQAIAIGHVGPEGGKTTAKAIQEVLPEFDRNKVGLVFVSELSGY